MKPISWENWTALPPNAYTTFILYFIFVSLASEKHAISGGPCSSPIHIALPLVYIRATLYAKMSFALCAAHLLDSGVWDLGENAM